MVVMGDMPFLNKLVQFRGGLGLQSNACHLYKIILDKCDDPYEPYKVKLGTYKGFLHAEYKPVGGPHYHGYPLKGWHNWVKVSYGESVFMCQILIFLEVMHVDIDNTSKLQVGKYALVNFVNQD